MNVTYSRDLHDGNEGVFSPYAVLGLATNVILTGPAEGAMNREPLSRCDMKESQNVPTLE